MHATLSLHTAILNVVDQFEHAQLAQLWNRIVNPSFHRSTIPFHRSTIPLFHSTVPRSIESRLPIIFIVVKNAAASFMQTVRPFSISEYNEYYCGLVP